MTTNTSFLGLTLYDATTDASALFLDYRTDMGGTGVSSNMNLIDNFANEASGSISSLEANPPTYVVTGSYVSPNTYGATVSGITSYDTNMIISLNLDTESDGTVVLDINGLGSKSLQKTDGDGGLINLTGSDLKINRDYYFRYNGSSWVKIGNSLADQVSINGTIGNLVSISGSNVLTDSQIETANGKITGSSIATSTGITSYSGSLILAETGVVAGSYNQVQVNSYGQIIEGSSVAVDTSISGSSVMSDTTGSEVRHNYSAITSGSYDKVEFDAFGHAISGSIVNSDMSVCFIPLNQSVALTGTETNYVRIPSKINGFNLVEVAASCSGSSTSGSPIFEVKNGATSMLTTNITIDEGEYDSSTATTQPVIDTDNDDVATGDKIWVLSSTSGCGTDVTYAGVELTFKAT